MSPNPDTAIKNRPFGRFIGSGGWIRLYPKGANQRPLIKHKRTANDQQSFKGSGGWIRTNDLRVMSTNLISLTLDLQAIHIGYTC